MPYSRLLRQGRIRRQSTNAQEIANLFKIVERDLADAAIEGLSTDRRFATAYNAALQSAAAMMRCEGYRARGAGHHLTTFEFLKLIPSANFGIEADYFDSCRVKRNIADYVGSGHISDTEAEDLLEEAGSFAEKARAWIKANHPHLATWS